MEKNLEEFMAAVRSWNRKAVLDASPEVPCLLLRLKDSTLFHRKISESREQQDTALMTIIRTLVPNSVTSSE